MALLTQLLVKAWPYLAALACGAVLAGRVIHSHDQIAYTALQRDFTAYRLQVTQENAQAQEAARIALQAQIDQAASIDAQNQEVIRGLKSQADSAAADAAFARRLLGAARATPAACPAGAQVPESPRESGAAATGADPGDGSIVDLAARAVGECRANARQLNALIEELRPQVDPASLPDPAAAAPETAATR